MAKKCKCKCSSRRDKESDEKKKKVHWDEMDESGERKYLDMMRKKDESYETEW